MTGIAYANLFLGTLACFLVPISVYVWKVQGGRTDQYADHFLAILLLCVCGLIFVCRDYDLGDTRNYADKFLSEINLLQVNGSFAVGKDPLFDIVTRLSAYSLSLEGFFTVVALLFLVPTYFAYQAIFPRHVVLALWFLASTHFFFSLGANVIRSGIAFAFFVWAISKMRTGGRTLPLLAIAAGFHISLIISCVCWYLAKYMRSMKAVYGVWLTAFVLSASGTTSFEILEYGGFTVESIHEDRIGQYFSGEVEAYRSGFRVDFISFSLIFILIGAYFASWRGFKDEFYLQVLRAYILTNAFFVLVVRVPFADRFALLSWVLIPIIVIYPLTRQQFFKAQLWTVAGMCCSMLAMSYVLINRI